MLLQDFYKEASKCKDTKKLCSVIKHSMFGVHEIGLAEAEKGSEDGIPPYLEFKG